MLILQKSRRVVKTVLLFLVSMFAIQVLAQDWTRPEGSKVEKFNKNAVYGSLGNFGLYFSASGYFERIVTDKKKSWQIERRGVTELKESRFATTVKVGYGAFADYFDQGQYLTAQLGIMSGAYNNHFELSAGFANFISGTFVWGFNPAGSIGYRYHAPGDMLLLRVGVAYPEGVYLGLGLSF